MLRTFLTPTLIALCLVACAQDRPKKAAPALNADDAGPDFAIQGEYVGKIGKDDYGVQIIALGKGKFRAVAYTGGLPGAGWDGEGKVSSEATAGDDGSVLFKNEDGQGVLKDGKLAISIDDKQIGLLKRTVRKSPTLGKKPPKGAVVLYGGADDADNWKGGKADENGHLQQGVTSKQTFDKPLTLHMEFMLSFMPDARGQGRSNSGVYLQGRHEVQILDSFGLEGKQNECGGLYSVKDPDLNMCLPPLSWQTYDVDFTPATFADGEKVTNARMTVRHNGVVIHDNVDVPHSSTASPLKEGVEPGPIYIQNHGNPVRFRNIWVQTKG